MSSSRWRWLGRLATWLAHAALIGGLSVLIGSLQFLAAVVIAGIQPGTLAGLVLFIGYVAASWTVVWLLAPPLNRLLGRRVGTWLAVLSQAHLYALAVDTANNSGSALQQVWDALGSWLRLAEMMFATGPAWPPLYVPAFIASATLVFLAGIYSD